MERLRDIHYSGYSNEQLSKSYCKIEILLEKVDKDDYFTRRLLATTCNDINDVLLRRQRSNEIEQASMETNLHLEQ